MRICINRAQHVWNIYFLHLQIDCKKLAYFYHQYPFKIMVLSMSHSMGLEMKYEMMQPVNYRSLSTIQMVVDRLESCLVMGGLSWLKTGAAGILGPGSLWGLSVWYKRPLWVHYHCYSLASSLTFFMFGSSGFWVPQISGSVAAWSHQCSSFCL